MTKKAILQKGERVLFLLLLGTVFFNIQKVLVPNALVTNGPYNEYLDVSVYLFDFLFMLLTPIFILNNINRLKSIAAPLSRFHVKHPVGIILIFLIAWSLLGALTAKPAFLSFLASWRLIEGILLFGYLSFYLQYSSLFHVELRVFRKIIVPRGTCFPWNNGIFYLLLVIGGINSALALFQFHVKHSIGLVYLGESVLSTSLPGVAKIGIGETLFLRGYGFFVHPNILAAFLGFLLLFLVEHFLFLKREPSKNCSTWNKDNKLFLVELFVTVIIVAGFIVSFSKAAIISFITVLAIRLITWFHVEQKKQKNLVPRGTVQRSHLFHMEHFIWITCGLGVFVVLYTVLKSTLRQSFLEREWGYVIFSQVIPSWNWHGIGIGNYVPKLYSYFSQGSPLWILQPIHNFFFLLYAEIGIMGLLGVTLFLGTLWNVSRETKSMFHVEQGETGSFRQSLLLYTVCLCFFDHYFWDIPQGIFLFWTMLAFVSIKYIDK